MQTNAQAFALNGNDLRMVEDAHREIANAACFRPAVTDLDADAATNLKAVRNAVFHLGRAYFAACQIHDPDARSRVAMEIDKTFAAFGAEILVLGLKISDV